MHVTEMTFKQAAKRYERLVFECYRDMAGGTQYGIDWPTVRAVFPERYAEMQSILKVLGDQQ